MINTNRKATFKKSIRMCMAIEEEHMEYIKQLAIQKSADEKRIITPSEMLRQAIYKMYPMPTKH